MGILDFLKKILKESTPTETPKEKIYFSEVENFLDKKQIQQEEKQKQVMKLIEEKIKSSLNKIKEKKEILERFDVDTKKVEDRAKIIVKQSLGKYLDYVNILANNLESIKTETLEDYTNKIHKIFSDFEKHSYNFYQKATFLIGEEIANLKKQTVFISDEINKIINENKDIINLLREIASIKLKIKQIKDSNDFEKQIKKDIELIKEKIKEKKESEESITEQINKVKSSKEHQENLENKNKIRSKEEGIQEKILNLKQIIDFKALTSLYHSDEKKMDLIKSYKENFSQIKENSEKLIKLLEESKLPVEPIKNFVENIISQENELNKLKVSIKKDETLELSEELKMSLQEISNLEEEKSKQEKRMGNVVKERQGIIDLVKQEVSNLGVIVE